jgi:hypothetical protein
MKKLLLLIGAVGILAAAFVVVGKRRGSQGDTLSEHIAA